MTTYKVCQFYSADHFEEYTLFEGQDVEAFLNALPLGYIEIYKVDEDDNEENLTLDDDRYVMGLEKAFNEGIELPWYGASDDNANIRLISHRLSDLQYFIEHHREYTVVKDWFGTGYCNSNLDAFDREEMKSWCI